jgi:predicted transcriptional regulator of viral defense system
MKSAAVPLSARQYIEQLAASGRYSFSSREAQKALGVSADAAKLALNRLAKQTRTASPAKGFHVIVPPEYRSLGCLPAEQFLPSLMEKLKASYYVGLLSAAQFHGAGHQRPQALQVFVERQRRPIECGRVRVLFMVHKKVDAVPVESINTPRGALRISTPEATALDLIGYEQQTGGLNLVATVLAELVEKIDADKLAKAAQGVPIPWAQRLGYILEKVGAGEKATALKPLVHARARQSTPLQPAAPVKNAKRLETWKLFVNADVETDL